MTVKRLLLVAVEAAVVALVLGVGGLVGIALQEPAADYRVVEEDLEGLRTAFNSKIESVRAVLLASPT